MAARPTLVSMSRRDPPSLNLLARRRYLPLLLTGADRLQQPRKSRGQPDLIGQAAAELDRALVDWRYRDRWSQAWLAPAQNWSKLVWQRAMKLGPWPIAPSGIAASRRVATAPVYICGAPRSGTTLVRDLLDGHPELAVLPAEGKFFKSFGKLPRSPDPNALADSAERWLQLLANPNHQRPFWVLGDGCSENSPYVTFGRVLIAMNAALNEHEFPFRLHSMVGLSLATARGQDIAGLGRCVDKSPGYEFHVKTIWSRYPESKVIQVIRNPRAIAASYAAGLARNKLEWTPVGRMLRNVTGSFLAACRAAHFAPRERFLVVHYENLVADRKNELRRIASFLGIDWDECLVRQTIMGLPAEPNSSFQRCARNGFEPASASEHFWLAAAATCHTVLR